MSGLWYSSSPSARSLSRSPSPPPPYFTQSPSPPRSLVRDGQTSPHRPRLVVSRSTCPPLSLPPQKQLYNRYCSNKHTHTAAGVRAQCGGIRRVHACHRNCPEPSHLLLHVWHEPMGSIFSSHLLQSGLCCPRSHSVHSSHFP
jgi:hypothetical protein